jgi:glutamate synthase domain-containing protein 3
MHGGNIYIRGSVDPDQLGKEVGIAEMADEDWAVVRPAVEEYGRLFGVDVKSALQDDFCRLWPKSKRPYGRLYAY